MNECGLHYELVIICVCEFVSVLFKCVLNDDVNFQDCIASVIGG